ncbi:hypothetical protein MAR_000330 [Mya arenaria]|uniref:Uncharacterized protein n=1 Tax=Mya arenaria TaxID=6604 RepID=A0ABY7FBS5_MYAAR|nr:hypothetical protein MAR_000330 [Mya arenaria]
MEKRTKLQPLCATQWAAMADALFTIKRLSSCSTWAFKGAVPHPNQVGELENETLQQIFTEFEADINDQTHLTSQKVEVSALLTFCRETVDARGMQIASLMGHREMAVKYTVRYDKEKGFHVDKSEENVKPTDDATSVECSKDSHAFTLTFENQKIPGSDITGRKKAKAHASGFAIMPNVLDRWYASVPYGRVAAEMYWGLNIDMYGRNTTDDVQSAMDRRNAENISPVLCFTPPI